VHSAAASCQLNCKDFGNYQRKACRPIKFSSISSERPYKTHVNRLKQSWNPTEIPGRGVEEKIHVVPRTSFSGDVTDIPAAVVANADTAVEETEVSPVCPYALKTANLEKRGITRGEADDINNNLSSSSYCNLFKLGRSFPSDSTHVPPMCTLISASSRRA